MTIWDTVAGQRTMAMIEEGMRKIPDMGHFDMRDYFATQFMNGYCNNMTDVPGEDVIEKIALYSYKMADAMIKARK